MGQWCTYLKNAGTATITSTVGWKWFWRQIGSFARTSCRRSLWCSTTWACDLDIHSSLPQTTSSWTQVVCGQLNCRVPVFITLTSLARLGKARQESCINQVSVAET